MNVALLPPPLSNRTFLIAAARRRGLNQVIIGEALGISRQRVEQLEQRYVRWFGKITEPRRKQRERSLVRIPWTCMNCGKVEWKTKAERPLNEYETNFCSAKCNAQFHRVLEDEDIWLAIDMRYQQHTWSSIQRHFKRPFQTIQTNIWKLLHKNGLLKRSLVAEIWAPTNSEFRHGPFNEGRWNWLKHNTGLIPD